MTRRSFSLALAGAVAVPSCATAGRSPVVILTAIAGARLPETLAIRTPADGSSVVETMRESVWELRTYSRVSPALAGLLTQAFQRAGIRPVCRSCAGAELTYLIPFASLSARERAWTTLNVDPQWTRARPRFQSYRFGLYRVA
jgi:hypothetical protein